jgi:cell wall-associated NlpC family hydrolase
MKIKYRIVFQSVTLLSLFLLSLSIPLSAYRDDPTLRADFPLRDRMPQSNGPDADPSLGPVAARFPGVTVPSGYASAAWKRARIIAAAKKYIGLPYRHHHIPGSFTVNGSRIEGGIDCSNFAAWVYNYGLGIYFASGVREQASGVNAPGRRLLPEENPVTGDLLFIRSGKGGGICHVAIFIDKEHIIDSTDGGVKIRPNTGWYRDCFSHARRIIE